MTMLGRNSFDGAMGVQGEGFPNPFLDAASAAMPHSLRNALYWCEYIYSFMGTYRQAMERVIAYFTTDVEFSDGSDEVQAKYGELYDEVLGFAPTIQVILRDRMCYGNGFASFIVPFQRFLACPRCGSSWTLEVVYEEERHFHFEFTPEFDFVATCPRSECGFRGPFRVDDITSDDQRNLRMKHWSPHEIELLHDLYTGDTAYLWRIPEDYKQQLRAGHLFHLQRATKQVLEAVRRNCYFRFKPDALFHMKEPTLSGIRNRGWGLPRILSNYRQIWYVQVLRRMNEAIALDYVIPTRVITPDVRPGAASGAAGDPLAMFNGGDASALIRGMIRRRRGNPAAWQVLPFPVRYTLLGGDANALAPRDLIDQGYEMLLNDAGTPVELYKGSLQLQTAPTALRLFESTWQPLVHDANAFLRWTLRKVSEILGWEALDGSMQRVTISDDIQKQMAMLQLMAAEKVSQTTALKAMDIDFKRENRLKADEARSEAETQARVQEEMAQSGFAQQLAKGQMAGAQGQALAQSGGQQGAGEQQQAPPPLPVDQYLQGMSSDTPQTPEDMMAVADSLAQSLLGMPETDKDSQLRRLKQYNEPLHAMVRSRMDSYRSEARRRGAAAGGAPPAAA